MWLKKPLSEQMETAYLIHRELLQREYVGPGDMEAAMYRLQAKYGLDYWRQWQLKYRRTARPDFIQQLEQARFIALRDNMKGEIGKLQITAAKLNAQADMGDLVGEAQALLAETKDIMARIEKALGR